MRTLIAPTEPFIKVEQGTLAADATAGSNVTLNVGNNDGLSENDFIVVGYEGSELAELQQINAAVAAGAAVQVATLKFNHAKGEPWVKYRYNKRKFYGATSEDGTYNHLTDDGSPKDIQADDPQGTLLEYTGNEGYTWFKATYYNSADTVETSTADAVAVEADEAARYASLWDIRKHAGLQDNPFYSDLRIETKRKQAENEINSVLYARYSLPLAEVPPLLSQICELLAAGYIDFEEFGKDGQGVKWLGEARALLKGVAKGERLLIGADGGELSRRANAGRISGYPDDSIDAGSAEDFQFKTDLRF